MALMLPRLNLNRIAFFVCDIQEKFRPVLHDADKIISVANRLLDVSETLAIPVIVTEQYSKGLGATCHELRVRERANCAVYEKTQFSMFTPQVRSALPAHVESIVLFGIETHVCVYQTVKDLLENDYQVFIPADGVSSRFRQDHDYALQQMQRWNASVTTSESIVFELLRDSTHPHFKRISSLFKDRQE